MSDAAAAPAKTKKAAKPRKPKVAASHPPTSSMVKNAIKTLKERKGSSLAAIKKFIAANYKVDPVKIAPFIRKYLKKAVEEKQLIQIKGSYKLSEAAKKDAPAKKPKAKKPKAKKPKKPKAAAKKPKAKKPKAKKAAKPKKVKAAAKPKKAKTPKKKPAKKTAKPKAKKPAKKSK